MDKILLTKDAEDLADFLDKEKTTEESYRLQRQENQMSKVVLSHKYGVGDCPCNNCSRG